MNAAAAAVMTEEKEDDRSFSWKTKCRPRTVPKPRGLSLGELMALATQGCVVCRGTGRANWAEPEPDQEPCRCVFREVFFVCCGAFRESVEREHSHMSHLTYDAGRMRLSRPDYRMYEYAADFRSVSARALRGTDWLVFKYRFLLGLQWRACCARLDMDRGTFFHATERIKRTLGRVFCTLQPYPLFPVSEYLRRPEKR